jgi:nucleoid DNA-binding protein
MLSIPRPARSSPAHKMQALRPRLLSAVSSSSERAFATAAREVAKKAVPAKDETLQYKGLVSTVADRLDLEERDVKQVVAEALDVIMATVAAGGKVTLTGACVRVFHGRRARSVRAGSRNGAARAGSLPDSAVVGTCRVGGSRRCVPLPVRPRSKISNAYVCVITVRPGT